MKRMLILAAAVCLMALPALRAQPLDTQTWHYELLEGSYLLDDCLICGRPVIQQPLRGSFDLVAIDLSKSHQVYLVTNISFATTGGISYLVTGTGTLEITGLPGTAKQTVILDVSVNGQAKVLTNDVAEITRLRPMLEINLVQTNVDYIHYYTLNLEAAPLRELWFTTVNALFSTNLNLTVQPGDLLADTGRVVKRSSEMVRRFGFQPTVGGAPVQAVTIGSGAETFFSLVQDEFSETQGRTFHAGDLLADNGSVLVTNQDLLANFQPQDSLANYGLNALYVDADGQIFFSVTTNFVSQTFGPISAGDLLSYSITSTGPTNRVQRTSKALLAKFSPAQTNADPGLDAIYVWSSGEIWFSTERDFNSLNFGPISNGDVLSDQGYVIFRGADLLAPYAPTATGTNIGLNAVFVVSDAMPAHSSPVFTRSVVTNQALWLNWTGQGRVFQVERAAALGVPFLPDSPLQPALSFADPGVGTNSQSFYRLRQWW